MGVAAEAFLDGTCAVFGAGEGREIGGDAVDDPLANGAGRAASERRIKGRISPIVLFPANTGTPVTVP